MLKRSRDHLLGAGETYFQHLRFALLVGFITVGAGLACIIHAIVPALCERTCSRTLGQLSSLFADRHQLQRFEDEASGVFTFAALVLLAAATVWLRAAAGGPFPLLLAVGGLAFSIPAVFLSTNPQLDPVSDSDLIRRPRRGRQPAALRRSLQKLGLLHAEARHDRY